MPSKIWNKYKKIKEIESNNSNIKTYLANIQPIVKEIIPKNKNDYYIISERLGKLKEELEGELKIYEIIEEYERIYIVIDNDEELLSKIDNLILSDELDIKKEGIIQGHGRPFSKEEIFDLFKMEKSMCKISFETNRGETGKGSGFFCEIDNFPFKYALFTNNHVLNESNIEIGKKIHFECLLRKSIFNKEEKAIKKKIKITEKRHVFTNKELDYTCIELFESDGITDYFKIEPKIFKKDKNNLKDNDIFILQYPNGNDLSFSYGKIKSLKENDIIHDASTDDGSSGSPIIRRSKDNYIIGLHKGGIRKFKNRFQYNLATSFDSILDNIKKKYNIINCIYMPDKDKTEINLLHDYNKDINNWIEKEKKEYIEVKKDISEENIEIYVNDKKIKFDYKYRIKEKESKEIKVKFKFKKLLTNISYIFYECSSLKSIDLSLFNTTCVNNMICMFSGCSSLKSIDLSSFNTTNFKDLSWMFSGCISLESIDLSSFNTANVGKMSYMFYRCTSLKSIDLTSFNTTNAKDMSGMFCGCSSLESIDLSSFDTTNVYNIHGMFFVCPSLKKDNIKIKNKNDKLLKEFEQDLKIMKVFKI